MGFQWVTAGHHGLFTGEDGLKWVKMGLNVSLVLLGSSELL